MKWIGDWWEKNMKDSIEQISMTSQICFFKLLPVHARAASSRGDTVLRWREIWLYQIKSNRSRFIHQRWGQVDNRQVNYEPNYLRKWSLRAYLMSMSQKDPFAHYFHSWVPSGTASLLNFNNTATAQIFANKFDVCHTKKTWTAQSKFHFISVCKWKYLTYPQTPEIEPFFDWLSL